MQTLFNRIQTQLDLLQAKNPCADGELTLNPPATDADFDALEKLLGYAVPAEFKELYQIANGEASMGWLMGEEWLSIEHIMDEYRVWLELYEDKTFMEDDGTDFGCEPKSEAIKADFWWNPCWISLSANGMGDSLMIDLDPAPSGTVGQILQMWHDDGARELKAHSLRELLEKYAKDLETDNYVLHPDYGLILKADLDDDELMQLTK